MITWILSSYVRNPQFGTMTTEAATSAATQAVQPLETRVQSLELACAGMWEIMKKMLQCTDEELVAMIQEVDARDGTVDGKITVRSAGKTCPNCRRQVLTKNSPKCIWCSAVLPREVFGQ